MIRTIVALALLSTIACTKAVEPPVKRISQGSAQGDLPGSQQTPNSVDQETRQTNQTQADGLVHFEAPCIGCHEEQRPAVNHIQSMDCASCHQYNDWAIVTPSAFSHDPKPETCSDCHARPESGQRSYPNQGPPADFVMDADYPGSGHYKGKDCKDCHQTPQEGSERFAFTHRSPNPQACLPCHFNEGLGEHGNDADVLFQGFGNCQQCHQNFDANQNRNFNPINGD